jgi:hypothetical protein
MECFRIDESGYTGFDLLNADQPFQGATAIAISDDDAARLIKEHFPKLQAADQFIHLVPSVDFEAQKRFRSGTQADEVIDYFGSCFFATTPMS